MLSTAHRKVAIWATLSLVVSIWLVHAAAGQDEAAGFCAVRLRVTDTDGRRVPSAVADLVDKRGRVVRTENVVNGRADFCDFGFGRYSILVHDKRLVCGAAEIKGVHVIYGLTQNLGAVLNVCADDGDYVTSGCNFYVRVATPEGQPVRGVQIKSPSVGEVKRTDKYGRALIFVTTKESFDYTLSHPGYRTKMLHVACPSLAGPPFIDLPVILER
jgi:hypothetical protein